MIHLHIKFHDEFDEQNASCLFKCVQINTSMLVFKSFLNKCFGLLKYVFVLFL